MTGMRSNPGRIQKCSGARLCAGPFVSVLSGDPTMKRLQSITLLLTFLSTPTCAEQVQATWYGNELRGHRTASGEMFNPSGMTAAHRSLPFGTCLVIGNPRTGRKVAVRVNDRGPFTPGIMLDLSFGAAEAIGMRSTQSVTVSPC
jgi:rare lipoprotein A